MKSGSDERASNGIGVVANFMADVQTGIPARILTQRRIYPHKAGLPPPLKSPRHRNRVLPTGSTGFLAGIKTVPENSALFL